jgi:hypothetical protein
LFSIIRLEQNDGGVYVEMEAIALSREIPGAVRLIVDPIVRRVSHNSILTSIQQTEEAVRGNTMADVKAASSPAHAGQLNSASAVLKNQTTAFAPVR